MVLQVGFMLLVTVSCAVASTDSWWFTRVWQTDDGLLNNNIHAIVQSRDGFLWLVTPTSLTRFDGVSFSQFPVKDYTGVTPHNIRTVLYDSSGVLWIVPNLGGMIGLNSDFSLARLPKSGLPASAPASLTQADDGSLWLGYSTAIYRVNNGQVQSFGPTEGMPQNGRPQLTSDGAGNIWLAKGNRLCIFQDGKFKTVAGARDVECLTGSETNSVWYVNGGHLFACDTEGATQDCGAFEDSAVPVLALLEDRTGAVWIGTDGNGLYRYDPSGFERIETSHSTILSIATDREGDIWAGTGGGGLDRIFLNSVRLESDPTLGQVQSICEDTNAVLWGATHLGALVSRINGRWQSLLTNAPFEGLVRCVAADPKGGIWLGTRTGKVFHLFNSQYTECKANPNRRAIVGLLPTRSGALWVIDRDACYCLYGGHWQDIRLPRQIDGISAIAEDAAGAVWVGARSAVARFNGKDFTDETSLFPISDHNISCLYGTPDGSMWISGGGLGLLRYKDGHVTQVGTSQGLFNDYISQIVADGHGWFWFASDLGVFKIRQRELETAMEHHDLRLRPILYGRNEGLTSVEALFSTAAPNVLPHAICTRDGRVWLLTHTGIVVADPGVSPDNYSGPQVLLTRVEMDGQTIASYGDVVPGQSVANVKTLNEPLRLPPWHHHLEFAFTACNFRAAENIHFRYQLEGFDSGWIDAGQERYADFSRLTAGNYRFRVAACVGDGPWSQIPAAISLIVTPFFWQTWWFRIVTLLVLISSTIVIVRYISFRHLQMEMKSLEQQAAIERERGRIARDIHDDLGNRLTKIQLLAGLAQRDPADKSNGHVRQISSAAQEATNSLDEIVWAINPRNDTLPHLINYLGQFVVEFLRSANIRCRVDLPDHPPVKPVSAEVRHNLFLAVKEALNNIVRHAQARQVSLIIFATDESISIVIEDDGCGFNGKPKNDGADGVENMRQRMEEIGGRFQIKSTPGSGTWVSFNGPWLAKK